MAQVDRFFRCGHPGAREYASALVVAMAAAAVAAAVAQAISVYLPLIQSSDLSDFFCCFASQALAIW